MALLNQQLMSYCRLTYFWQNNDKIVSSNTLCFFIEITLNSYDYPKVESVRLV